MLIGEAVSRIKHLHNKGVESFDSRLSNRFIYSKLKTVRERLLSQEIKKKQVVSEWSYQTIPCVEMIIAPSHECPCIPSEGCEILKSKHKIPQIFTDDNKHIIKSVSKIVGTGSNFTDIEFSETTWMKVKYNGGNKFAKTPNSFYIHNEYLYIINNKKLEVITMVALFNDPIEAENFATILSYCPSNVNACKSYLDFDMHLDGKLDEALIQLTAEEIIYVYAQMKDDTRNDNDDSTGGNIPNPKSYRNVDKDIRIN
jgi:hypothetical protein